MRVGDVARSAGVTVRALHYYEEQGLLKPSRTAAGQRVYDEDVIERVRLFQDFFAAGLSSRRIAELLPCIDTGTTNAEQRRMLAEERARLTQRIDQLAAARDRLDILIAAARSTPTRPPAVEGA